MPLSSNALAMRYDQLAPGPELVMQRPEQEEAQGELLEVPSVLSGGCATSSAKWW